MKNPIEWHEDCLKNTKIYLSGKKSQYDRMGDEIKSLEEKVEFYTIQIELAKKKKILSFDEEKFGIRRTHE